MHKYFLLCSDDRHSTLHLKQCQPTPFVSALSLESLTIATHYKFHKSPKTAVAFETSLRNEYPTFQGRCFSEYADRTCWTIQTHSEVSLGRRRTFHELNSLNLARLMKSSTFGLGLRLLKEDPNETLFKILPASFFILHTSLLKKRKKSVILLRTYKFLLQNVASHCHEM